MIGQEWKHSNVLSGLILIGRGLDQVFEVRFESRIETRELIELIVIFSFEGTIGETRKYLKYFRWR